MSAFSDALTTEEVAAVAALRESLDAAANALLDDHDCMRFLRARSMDVSRAVEMASEWAVWYVTPMREGGGDSTIPQRMLDVIVDPVEEDIFTRLTPHILAGEDREGHPIYWERTGLCAQNFGQLKQSVDALGLQIRHVRMQEICVSRLRAVSARRGHRVEKGIFVMDCSHLGMSPDLDGIKYIIAMLGIDQKYYPERLHSLYAINCPWFFTAIYAMVAPFIDPVTKSKFHILGSNYMPQLLEHIDASQIPRTLGGEMDVEWHWPHPGIPPEDIAAFRNKPRTAETTTEEAQSDATPPDAAKEEST